MVVPVCVVSSMMFDAFLEAVVCISHWNGCMNVACRRTKPFVFLCKVAAAGDERCLECAAGAAGVVWFLLRVLQHWLFLCA